MSKRQAILLLGVLMANLWGSVVQAPAFRGRPVESEAPIRRQSPVRSVGSDEDLASLGRQGDSYPVVEMSGADEAALNWVKKYADGIAGYLHAKGIVTAQYPDISKGFRTLYNQSLDEQAFVDEETKMYMQGAVQAFLDELRFSDIAAFKPSDKTVQDRVDVSAWVKKYANKVVRYLQSQNESDVNFDVVAKACKSLNIPILHIKNAQDKEELIGHINDSLDMLVVDATKDGLKKSDDKYFVGLLSHLRSKGAMDVTKNDVLKAAQDLSLPKEFVFRLNSMAPRFMTKILMELNAELSVKHDPMVVERALGLIVQAQQAQTVLVDSAIDVIRAVAEQKSSEVDVLADFDKDKFVQDMVSYVQRNRILAKDMDLARFKSMIQALRLHSVVEADLMGMSQDDWDNNIKPLMLKDVYGVVNVDRVIDVIREVSVVSY